MAKQGGNLMIKIIFSDMDGTLLDENGQLPPDFDEVMSELKKRNVICIKRKIINKRKMLEIFSFFDYQIATVKVADVLI